MALNFDLFPGSLYLHKNGSLFKNLFVHYILAIAANRLWSE